MGAGALITEVSYSIFSLEVPEMVTLLYAVAGLLLILTVAADTPFTKTYLVVFLLARFIRIERRLDSIEGIQRSPRLKRAASWAWSKRGLFIGVGYLSFVAGVVWWSWGSITDKSGAARSFHQRSSF
jgi:hypothetical protein